MCEAWRGSMLYPCPWKDSRPSVISQTPSSSCCPAYNHSLTPCTVGTTHFNEFPWSKMFMIHSVSCFCQLFYPPNPSTPRIIILKILHSFTWDAYLHPSLHDFHMKVRPGQRKRFSSHRTLHHLPSPSLLNFSLYVFSPGTGSRHHHW